MSSSRFLRLTRCPPALLALLAQMLSFLCLFIFLFLVRQWYSFPLSLEAIVLFQITFALFFTYLIKITWWWYIFQACLPLGLYAMSNVAVPAAIYLVCFFVLFMMYGSIFKTQVPYYPSRELVWQLVDQHLPPSPFTFVDIGSGLGGILLYLAKKYPNSTFLGVEIALLPWLLSYARSHPQLNLTIKRDNYHSVHLAAFDVVFAYLSPAAMPALWEKAREEMRPGTLLISLEFAIPHVPATTAIAVKNGQKSNNLASTYLYLWRM